LLISSQISKNIDAYNYAKDMINSQGGIDFQLLLEPTVGVSDEPEERIVNASNNFIIPEFEKWCESLFNSVEYENIDFLACIIDSLLIMNNPTEGRNKFAKYCLLKSLNKNAS
jgi:hypothetical protein